MGNSLDLTTIERQNVLNNKLAIQEIRSSLSWVGANFDGEVVFTKSQLAKIFEVSEQTIERIIRLNIEELSNNGYYLLRGAKLNKFKELNHGILINEGTKISVLGVFSFRAPLNVGMLLSGSEKAKELRKKILDIAIFVVAKRSGGGGKYVNQRDSQFLPSIVGEISYRKKFTNALKLYTDGDSWRYARFTDLIYQAIFKENAKEYRKILRLEEKDNVRV